jgi:hypothetical protein
MDHLVVASASAAGAQARVAPAWAAVPIFAVALMKSGPSLLTEPYRKHEHSKMGDRTKFLERARRAAAG